MSSGLTLDSKALIAFERRKRDVVAIIARAQRQRIQLAAPAAVVAQVWRNGRRQESLARLLGSDLVELMPLDDMRARAAGQLMRGHWNA